jgi:hypothetical protein
MGVKVTKVNNTREVIAREQLKIKAALLNKAEDIGFTAQILAPKLTGALANSKEIASISDFGVEVSFNTKYATRRHYENEKHPETVHYLERAGEIESFKGLDIR